MIELRDVKHQIFVDYSINRCKIEDINGKVRTIGFTPYKDELGRLVFKVHEKDEKYCVV